MDATQTDSIKELVLRLLTLGAMAGLGTYYWRILRSRRHAAQGLDPGEVPGLRASMLSS